MKESESASHSVMSGFLQPHGLYSPPTPLSVGFSRREYWSELPCPSPGDLPNWGVKPRSPTLQKDSLPAESQGKPKNTGVGSLSLFQADLPTQELNRRLLHCRPILYQLSYQGSPFIVLHQLHLRSSGIRSWSLGTPALQHQGNP